MTERLRILLVEDVADDAELALLELRRAGLQADRRVVDSEEAFVGALREFAPEVILSDFSMPGFDGMAALALARDICPDTPFIFVSGTIGEESAVRALKSGAIDYVMKTNLVRLPTAVERALRDAKERTARRKAEGELEALRERLRSILSTLPDVVWSVAVPSREILYVSPAAATVFGRTQKEVYESRMLWGEPIHPEDRPRMMALWQDAVIGETFESEYRIVKPGGEVRWIQGRGRFAGDAAGNVVRIDGISRDITERREQAERLTYLAYYDALTGLPNRTLFHERLTQLLHAAKHGRTQVVVATGDINRFRLINDTFGRQAGDALLREFAQRLKTTWPEPDRVARISADIFACALADVRDPGNIAYSIDKTVAAIIEAPFPIEGKELRIATTAGVAVFPTDGEDADTLFRNAEAALKKAKESGERYLFYRPEMNSRVAETLLLENKLRQAIKEDQFVLHYQPKVDGRTGRVCGLEALIRWQDPETGLVPPLKFIPILEETGMILEVGQWAIRKALADSRRWRAHDGSPPRVAVNVSPIQLRQRNFVEAVRRSVEEAGVGGCQLDLEITEGLIMRDIEENIQKLSAIRDMGLQIAVDDFGTGYSSLAYLAKLPVNALKIDRSFIVTMTSNPQSMTIVSTIISLSHSLGLKVIAEGVDAEEQAKYLKLLSCDEMQGYLFSRPVPPNEVENLLTRTGGPDTAPA